MHKLNNTMWLFVTCLKNAKEKELEYNINEIFFKWMKLIILLLWSRNVTAVFLLFVPGIRYSSKIICVFPLLLFCKGGRTDCSAESWIKQQKSSVWLLLEIDKMAGCSFQTVLMTVFAWQNNDSLPAYWIAFRRSCMEIHKITFQIQFNRQWDVCVCVCMCACVCVLFVCEEQACESVPCGWALLSSFVQFVLQSTWALAELFLCVCVCVFERDC